MLKRCIILFIIMIFLIETVSAITTISPTELYSGQDLRIVIRPNRNYGFYPILYVMKNSTVVDTINTDCSNPCTTRPTLIDYIIPSNFEGQYYIATFDYRIDDWEFDFFDVLAPPESWQIYNTYISDLENPQDYIVNPIAGTNSNITINSVLFAQQCTRYQLSAYLCEPVTGSSVLSFGEIRKISNVGGNWQTVPLLGSYSSPVIVCTYNIPSTTDPPAVTRIKNITSSSFDLKIQNPCDLTTPTSSDVTCLIIEKGAYNLEDGTKLEAFTYTSTQTDRSGDWTPVNTGFSQSYANPRVIGQVMSYNDTNWSSFWCSNGNQADPPTSNLYTGKHVAEDPNRVRKNETMGYIVFEQGTGTIGNLDYEAGRTGNTIRGIDNSPPYPCSLSSTFSVGVASQVAMNGGNGGWAYLFGSSPITSVINLAIDEDQCSDSERNHAAEEVDYLVFSSQGRLTRTVATQQQTVCNSTNYTYLVPLTYQYRISNRNCFYQYQGTDAMQFFRKPGTWIVRVELAGTVSNQTNFTYNTLTAINYTDLIDFGNLVANQWVTSRPTGGVDLVNQGNIGVNLTWQGQNFQCVSPLLCSGRWDISWPDPVFQVDDDPFFNETTETGVYPAYLTNYSVAYFSPYPYLRTCISDKCNNSIGERFKTYYNMKIPELPEGTYEGAVQINILIPS
ncbi:MAG: hypothetical protein ABIE22_03585 [archaeon]